MFVTTPPSTIESPTAARDTGFETRKAVPAPAIIAVAADLKCS